MVLDFKGERLDFNIADHEDFMEHLVRYGFARRYAAGKVIDLACGVGYGSYFLCDALSVHQVVGADISELAISFARKTFTNSKLRFDIQTATRTNYPDSFFDTFISLETVEHIKDLSSFFQEAKRLLCNGGTFIMSVPNKKYFSDAGFVNEFHYHEMYYKELLELLMNYFKQFELFYQKYPLDRYERIRPKAKPNSVSLGRSIITRIFTYRIGSIVKQVFKNIRYSQQSKRSVSSRYSLDFEQFLADHRHLQNDYQIVAAKSGIYETIPGNFLAVCKVCK